MMNDALLICRSSCLEVFTIAIVSYYISTYEMRIWSTAAEGKGERHHITYIVFLRAKNILIIAEPISTKPKSDYKFHI